MAEPRTVPVMQQEVLDWHTTMYEREGTVGAHGLANAYAHFVSVKMSPTQERIHTALGLTGEAGEYADAIKKIDIYGKASDIENLREELGDILFYLQAACNYWGFTLEDLMASNVIKLSKRYKGAFTKEEAAARADKSEKELTRES